METGRAWAHGHSGKTHTRSGGRGAHAFLLGLFDVHELRHASLPRRVVARDHQVLLADPERLRAQGRISQLFDLSIKAIYRGAGRGGRRRKRRETGKRRTRSRRPRHTHPPDSPASKCRMTREQSAVRSPSSSAPGWSPSSPSWLLSFLLPPMPSSSAVALSTGCPNLSTRNAS